jgi:outer membrane protein assembly factor BamA
VVKLLFVHAVALRIAGSVDAMPGASLSARVGQVFDAATFDAEATAVRQSYVERGYPRVTAGWSATEAGSYVDIVIDVDPGPRVTVDGLEFRGNVHVASAELAAVAESDLTRGAAWLPEHVDHARRMVEACYADHGYAAMRVEIRPPVGVHGPAVFEIQEGDVFRLGTVAITGLQPARAARVRAQLALRAGQVFSRRAVRQAINELATKTSAREVEPTSHIDLDSHTIDITLEVRR